MPNLQKLLASRTRDQKIPPPPAWVRKSPEQLVPMLEKLRRKKIQDAADYKKANEIARKQVSVQVVSWGLAENKTDRPFASDREIRVPAGTRVYFRLRYRMPSTMRAIASIRMPGASRYGGSPIVSGNGEVVSMVGCDRPREFHKMLLTVSLKIKERFGKSFVVAEVPCRVIWE